MNSIIIVIVLIFILIFIIINLNLEKFIIPKKNLNVLLSKCFSNNEINSFTKYYNKTHIMKSDDGILFLTPNNIINEIPKITWNGYFLNNFCVEPTKRNRGIGNKLLRQAIKYSKQKKKDHIILQVYNKNINAIELYKKNGFKKYKEGINSNNEKLSFYIYYL